jgi:ABC-type antimicrobial peptide transport system permease subunit
MKDMFAQVMLWALLAIGGVAIIILSSIIGRTVSEGRRESAVFRAIGARRLDIASIYGVYTLLLSVRVALFAVVLGLAVSLTLELLFTEQATLAARYAYAAADAAPSFHFFSFISWFVPLIVAAIILFGLLASVIPVIRSARRNPITDMRDDT